jgi:proprotein convertase subtilisin/kexin type 2
MRAVLLASTLFVCLACQPEVVVNEVTSFIATPSLILRGESTTLEWKSTGAAGCRIEPGLGEVAASGSLLVKPTESTLFSIFCNNANKTVNVFVDIPVVIESFSVTPESTLLDGTVTLSWNTSGASGCILNPGNEQVEFVGSKSQVLPQTTTFSLTCTGPAGPAKKQVTATAIQPQTIDTPTGLAFTVFDGSLELRWTQTSGSANVYFASAAGITKTNVSSLPAGQLFSKATSPLKISGLQNGTAYYARVLAVSGTLESTLSPEVSGTPVGAPELNDPYFAEQWHLGGTSNPNHINVTSLWSAGIKGAGVFVAVVDEGVDLNHEDLAANVASGRSFDYLGNAPLRLAEHGTSVAGLIAARDFNGKGVRGVAPRANIASFNLLQDLTSANEYDSMVRLKALTSVSNNSWGDAEDGTGLLDKPDVRWLQGVTEGATTGRNGKGIVYFWAAGNGGDFADVDDSNFDGQANSRFVFSIAGVGADGIKAGYSEAGANVLVTAPTEGDTGPALTTTDITGNLGYNAANTSGEHRDKSYTKTFNGTSGATPVAAGVGALILGVRPELSWRDVRRVLAYSAKKNDPNDGDWVNNGAGLHVNHKYGYGAVDAANAVMVARNLQLAGGEVSFAPLAVSTSLAIPDNGSAVASTISVSGSGIGKLEFVEITLSLDHVRSGDVEIVLSKPGAVSDVLHPQHTCIADMVTMEEKCSVITNFTFGSARHIDEPADGVWTLTLKDKRAGITGRLTNWKMKFYGRNQ